MTAPVWIEKRHPQTGKLLFRYDPARGIIHIKPNGQPATYIELREDSKEMALPLDKAGSSKV